MAIYALIGIAISLVIVYPAYYSLQFGKNDFTTPDFGLRQNYTFLDIIGKLFPGSFDTVAPEGMPFLYGGTLTLLLLPFFFVTKRVKAKEKIGRAKSVPADVYKAEYKKISDEMKAQIEEASQGGEDA